MNTTQKFILILFNNNNHLMLKFILILINIEFEYFISFQQNFHSHIRYFKLTFLFVILLTYKIIIFRKNKK